MARKNVIGMHILSYLEEKGEGITFNEFYDAFRQFSKQGVRNSMYTLIEKGLVEKSRIKTIRRRGRSSVKFKLKRT